MKVIVNQFEYGPLANSIAFHGYDKQDIDVVNLCEYFVELCRSFGLEPTHMNVVTDHYESLSMKTYKREKKRLVSVPQHEILFFGFAAWNGNPLVGLGNGLFQANFKNHKRDKSIIITIDDKFFKFEYDLVKSICQKIIDFVSPHYAYMYARECKKGPVPYASGCIQGLPFFNCPECDMIDRWGKYTLKCDHQFFDLRDIYPIQMVRDAHLNRNINDTMTLRQFIESNNEHGRLESLDADYYLWWVDVENISVIREKLRPSNIMIAI